MLLAVRVLNVEHAPLVVQPTLTAKGIHVKINVVSVMFAILGQSSKQRHNISLQTYVTIVEDALRSAQWER